MLHQVACCLREHYLPAMGRATDTSRVMHIHTDVALGGELRLTCVHAHAHAHLHTLRPGISSETALSGHGSANGITGAGKGDEEGIPLCVHLVTKIHLKSHAQEPAALRQDLGV